MRATNGFSKALSKFVYIPSGDFRKAVCISLVTINKPINNTPRGFIEIYKTSQAFS
jgi:hypothetical protein